MLFGRKVSSWLADNILVDIIVGIGVGDRLIIGTVLIERRLIEFIKG